MIAIRTQGLLAGLLAGVCLSAAACFSASSGGNQGTATFPDSGEVDAFGADSTLPEESGADSTPDVAPETATDAGSDSASMTDSSRADATDSAATDSSSADAAEGGGALVRFANLVSNLATPVDFCVAPTGSAFTTPYMNTQGVSAGLAYKDVSEYAALTPASGFKVRVVAAGSSGCGSALAADVNVGPSLASSSPTTVTFTGVSGDGGPAPVLTGLSDDPASTTPASGIRFRAIHAAPSLGAADFEIGVSPYTQAMQTGVPYGATFSASTVATGGPTPDSNGYVVPGYGTAQVTVLLSGVETTSFYVADNGVQNASVTAFLVGAAGSVADPIGFVDCDELAAPTGHKASCPFNSAPPVTFPMRIFHGAPDQGAVDVCAAIGAQTMPYSPSLIAAAGNSGGATFLQLTGDLTAIPANTDFHVAFTPVGQSCATAAITIIGTSLRFQELSVGLYETFGTSMGYSSFIYETGVVASASSVALSFGNMAPRTGGQTVDVYASVNGMAEVEFYPMMIGETYGSSRLIQPGTVNFRVVDDGTMTNVYDMGGFTMNANATYFLWYLNQGSSTTGTLAQCSLDQRTSDSLVTCLN